MSKRYSNKGVNSVQNRPAEVTVNDGSTRLTLIVCGLALALIVVAVGVALLVNGLTVVPGACDMEEVKSEINSMKATDFVETDEKSKYVKISVKDYGDIVIRLREDVAPKTVENFQSLVSRKFYDGLTYHRIMKGFMIQGGAPKGDGTGYSADKIEGEFSANGIQNELSHIKGVISMARGQQMNSASCQFFISNDDATAGKLDGSYAAFGYVVAGLEVVDAISDVKVTDNGSDEVSKPVETIVIEKVTFAVRN